MTPDVRETIERARELLDAALVHVANGDAALNLYTDEHGNEWPCVVVEGTIRLVVCDPPIDVGAAGWAQ